MRASIRTLFFRFQCPGNKASSVSSIDQNEAVLAQIGQQLEAQASPIIISEASKVNSPSTPLLLDIVDPEQPPRRGRPKGVKSRAHSESFAPRTPPPDMSNMIGKMNFSQESHQETKVAKSRPHLKLTIPPIQASTPVAIAPQTAPVKAPHTPLPEWKARLKDKLLKRSMSVEKLSAERSELHPSGSQTAQVIIGSVDNVLPSEPVSVTHRPPFKRQTATVVEEPETKRMRIDLSSYDTISSEQVTTEQVTAEQVTAEQVTAGQGTSPEIPGIETETVIESRENLEITVNEDDQTMTIIDLESGKKNTVVYMGQCENVVSNMVSANDVIMHEELPPNNAVYDKLTFGGGIAASQAKTRPDKLPVLHLSSGAAQRIPGLVPVLKGKNTSQLSSGDVALSSEASNKEKSTSQLSSGDATLSSEASNKEKNTSQLSSGDASLSLEASNKEKNTSQLSSGDASLSLEASNKEKITSQLSSGDASLLLEASSEVAVSPTSLPSTETYPIPEDLHDKAAIVYLLTGHTYPMLVSDPSTTFCSLLKPQPMYVEHTNSKISMYSNWRTAQPAKLPLDLEIREFLGLQQTRRKVMEDSVTVSAGREQPHLTESSYWKERHGEEEREEKVTVQEDEVTAEEQEVIVIDGDMLDQAQKVTATSVPNILRASRTLQQQRVVKEFTVHEVRKLAM